MKFYNFKILQKKIDNHFIIERNEIAVKFITNFIIYKIFRITDKFNNLLMDYRKFFHFL